jgi:hypothetical protein
VNKKTLRALRGSIEKWRKIAEGTGVDAASDNCQLCKLFFHLQRCKGCPVAAKTGTFGCLDTPYVAWSRLPSEDKDFDTRGNRIALTAKAKRVARREQRFLESLLPEGEQP